MKEVMISDEYIKLGQLMKFAGCVQNGSEAKFIISEGKVKVNNRKEIQRGKKIREGDIVEYNGEKFLICR